LRYPSAIVLLTLAAGVPPSTAGAEEDYETVVRGRTPAQEELSEERATSAVTRRDLDRRLPRSAPDALRYEPGVFVQQSAHGQGSAYLRGLTGQQTLILFDGIRLNNSTYRQGPNQYFFTLDSRTIRSIEVERGGGSTRWGSDALGGVIFAHPIEPTQTGARFMVEPRLLVRGATSDTEIGGRFQLDASGKARGVGIAFVGGIGGRNVGLLQGPPVLNPSSSTEAGPLPWVPRYQGYDPTRPLDRQALTTQLGTGFQELTGDARLVLQLAPEQQITLATYLYRELNAPRTDQCPPPAAPYDQCLTYEQQFRHLAYAAWKGRLGRFAERARVTLSWQEQHERRRLDLTAANLVGHGTDDVETFGLSARAETAPFRLARWLALRVDYGVDNYVDWVSSRAEHAYTDVPGVTIVESRGQYLEGSRYIYGGAYADLVGFLGSRFAVHGGARLSWAAASAPGDPDSGSAAFRRHWVPVVGRAGLEARVARTLRLFLNYDASYRTPNLDDLTSRQQTGPGFQFENPLLRPEKAHTFELGARLRTSWLAADAWLFETVLLDSILKVSRDFSDCPANTPQCQSSWSRYQLQNAPSRAELRGFEATAMLFLPWRLSLRTALSYVWSEGPRVGELSSEASGVSLGDRVPLSRTPPLNGSAELWWSHRWGFALGAALQWAAPQNRLAVADYSDGRIPKYGTPGFAVLHLRATYRVANKVVLSMVLENVFNSPYRFHGSSVNGAGRGLIVQAELAHWY
jgi:outer membrane receptor protein involved in Fe transport